MVVVVGGAIGGRGRLGWKAGGRDGGKVGEGRQGGIMGREGLAVSGWGGKGSARERERERERERAS